MKPELESVLPLRDTNLEPRIFEALRSGQRSLYLRLLRQLWQIYPRVAPKLTKRDALSRLKFVVRGTLHGEPMDAWLEFLRRPEMREFANRQPLLYIRLQWPYISRSFPIRQRLQLLQNHYNFILRRFSPGLRSAAFSKTPLKLAKWQIATLGNFALSLHHLHESGHEGEMILSLDHEDTARKLAFLHFSISYAQDGQPEIYIGCLQGGKADATFNPHALTAKFTRHTYGSRPKNLLIFVLRRLASHWAIPRIRAVSTHLHVYRPHLKVDYDAFWKELGGVQQTDGFFELPLTSGSLEDTAEMKPKRRPAYRRRCQLWDSLSDQIDGTLKRLS